MNDIIWNLTQPRPRDAAGDAAGLPSIHAETWNHRTPLGTPIYAIDDRQRSVHGIFQARHGATVVIETDLGPCRRRRSFHARYVTVDLWATIHDLP